MPVFNNMLAGASGAGGDYVIERSLRFNSEDSSHLSKTFAAGNRRTWTWSSWVKRSKLGTDQTIFSADEASGTWFIFQFDTSDRLMINWTAGTGGAYTVTTAKFRDPSAWYHLVLAFDTTAAADANKVKLYVNGVLITARDVTGYPSANTEYQVNHNNKIHKIGTGAHNADLYLADVQFIDGQALEASNFGNTDAAGTWQPKKYSGTYGTTGFHLEFNEITLGLDTSGNNNNWESHNLISNAESVPLSTIANVAVDTVTGSWNQTGSAFPTDSYSALCGSNAGTTETITKTYLTPLTSTGVFRLKTSSNTPRTIQVAFNGGTAVDYAATGQYNAWQTGISCPTSITSISLIWPGLGTPGFDVQNLSLDGTTNALLPATKSLTFTDSTNFDKYAQGDVVGIKNSPGIVTYVGSISHTTGLDVHNLFNATGGKAYAAKQADCGTSPAGACDGNPTKYRTNGACAGSGSINYMECSFFSGLPTDQFIQFNAPGFRPTVLTVGDWNAVNIAPPSGGNVRNIVITYHDTSNTTTVNNYVNGASITLLNHDIYRITLDGNINGYDKNNGKVLEFSMLFDGKPLSADVNGVRAATITAVNASTKKILTAGGSWYGTDGTGDTGDGRYEPAQQWSNQVIGNVEGFYGTIIQNIFNGTISTGTSGGTTSKSGESLVLNFGSELSSAQNVTIYGYSAGATAGSGVLKINDVDVLFSSSTGDNNTTFSLSNGLQKIEWSNVSASAYIYVQGIKVDGVFLKDFDITGGRGNTTILKNESTKGDNVVDTPTDGKPGDDTGLGAELKSNYAVLNPLATAAAGTLSDGNLQILSSGHDASSATIGVSSGKWYWEYQFTGTTLYSGITATPNDTYYIGSTVGSIGIAIDGGMYMDTVHSNQATTGFTPMVYGDIIGNELDLDNGTFRHYVNGAVQPYATQSLDTSKTWFAAGSSYGNGYITFNFGQKAFHMQAPSGFKCLCTTNLGTTVKVNGSYTGNSNDNGRFVFLNGVPTAMTIGGTSINFDSNIDKLANGFKIRSATVNNTSGSNYVYSVTTNGGPFKNLRAQIN